MVSLPNAAMERSARKVHLLRVRTPDSALSSRIQSWLEESLRLTTLPGEDQGRVYFFRHLRLPVFSVSQPALEWIARCSERLLSISHSAVHIADAQSDTSDSVYGLYQHEPFRLLFSRWLAGGEAREWFWPQATGVASALPHDAAIQQLFARWYSQHGGWPGVAREFLPSLHIEQVVRALELIRPEISRQWLASMSRSRPQSQHAVYLPILRAESRAKLYRAQLRFGDHDPRVRWLCALVILETAPSLTQDALLPEMLTRILAASSANKVLVPDAAAERFADNSRNRISTGLFVGSEGVSPQSAPAIADGSEHQASSDCLLRDDLGRITAFAGFYFLLTPLRLLGIADAYKIFPELAITHFVERVLLRLARSSGIKEGDPVLLPYSHYFSDALLPPDPLAVPNTLTSLRRLRPSPAQTERLWAAAVRRWCHRQARMRIAEIISRHGRIYVTPTALDITMLMSAVDIRIRRCGLDIDPGYQPWFGQVVHFHYHVEVQHEPQSSAQP